MRLKICGINELGALEAVGSTAADAVGFVFFERSPRAVTLAKAAELAAHCPPKLAKVALVVDADDALLDAIMGAVRPDWLQLHGHESPERAAALKARYTTKLMKAVGVASAEDLRQTGRYEGVVDRLLLDAKPPKDAALPGGNGTAFDWHMLDAHRPSLPWMLAGGLEAGNVATAITASGAQGVDVSSGVESAPGHKSPEKITAFVQAAQAALDAAAVNA